MGFPAGCTEIFIPIFCIQILSFLEFLRNLISSFLHLLGFSVFLEPTASPATTDQLFQPENPTHTSLHHPSTTPLTSALLIREFLPAVRISDAMAPAAASLSPSSTGAGLGWAEERCAVCLHDLYEYEGGGSIDEVHEDEEVRWLVNCKHIFHRVCLDRWIDHNQTSCPLCRTQLIPHDKINEFNQRLSESADPTAAATGRDYLDDYDGFNGGAAVLLLS